MRKSLLSFVLLTLFAALGSTVIAQTFTEPNEDGVNITYSVTSGTYVRIEAANYTGRVSVPDYVTHEGTSYEVTSVATRAFANCTGLEMVSLPSTISYNASKVFENSDIDTVYLRNSAPSWTNNQIRLFFSSTNIHHLILPCSTLRSLRSYLLSNISSNTIIGEIASTCSVPVVVVAVSNDLTKVYACYTDNGNLFESSQFEINDSILFVGRPNISLENGAYIYPEHSSYITAWHTSLGDFTGTTILPWKVTQPDSIFVESNILPRDTINNGNISTVVGGVGQLGYVDYQIGYFYPANTSLSPIYSTSLWIDGEAQGQRHLSALKYGPDGFDYVPGSIGGDNARTFKVTRDMIDDFIAHATEPGYQVPDAIRDWPAKANGDAPRAPFYDADGDGEYNSGHGDYPLIRGDQMVYTIFNDNTTHNETNGLPLGVEVHMMTYAFNEPSFQDFATDQGINQTIFVTYQIYNRSSNNYTDCYVGAFTDFDLGYGYDDYVGTDVQLGMSYCYNGDEYDGPSDNCYGEMVPAQGMTILAGPTRDANAPDFGNSLYPDRLGMCKNIAFTNSTSSDGDPTDAEGYSNILHGKWKNGDTLFYGGTGIPCHFIYPGNSDPQHLGTDGVNTESFGEWYEHNSGYTPGDRRTLSSCGPFTLAAGQMQQLDLAYTTALYLTDETNESVQMLQDAVTVMRQIYLRDTTPSGRPFTYRPFSPVIDIAIDNAPEETPLQLYPNPTTGLLQVTLGESNQPVQLFNIMGRLLLTQQPQQGAVTLNLTQLPAGVYFIRCGNQVQRVVKR